MTPHFHAPIFSAAARALAALSLALAFVAGMPDAVVAQSGGGATGGKLPSSGTLAPAVTPPVSRILPPTQPKIVPRTSAPPVTAAPPPPGPPIRVDQVRFEGVTVYSPASLRPLYAGMIGKPVPRTKFDDIVVALQTRYRNDGYILTLVRGSFEKKGTHLVFVVHATEGYISDIKLQGDIGPAGELVLRTLRHLTTKRPVRNRDLERYLLLANDIPGVTVHAVLRRGGTSGAVELVAELSRKRVSGLLNFDNRGSPEAGPPEILVSGSLNSFTNFGERTQALLYSTFNREQIFGQVSFDGFLNSDGLRFHTYLGAGNNQPGGVLKPVGFNGDLEIGGGAISYSIVRSRRLNLSTEADLDAYHSAISLGGFGTPSTSGSNLWIGRVGGALDFQDDAFFHRSAANAMSLKVSYGLLGTSSVRPGDNVHFTKVDGEFTRVQDLVTIGRFRTALKSSIGGQYTGDILPPSEKYFLGGTRFGRGFFSGEVTGDQAIGASLELQVNTVFTDVPLANPSYRLPAQFYGFWDYGRGYNLAPFDIDHTVQSLGIGFRSDVTPWLFLELEGDHRLTTYPQGRSVAKEGDYAFFTRVTLHY